MNNREANNRSHPPACTCVDCVNRRLGIVTRKKHQPNRVPSSSAHTLPNNQFNTKREYPIGVRIISNIILSLMVILALGLFGGGIYGIAKYHGDAWNWVSKEYHSIANNVINFKDKLVTSVSTVYSIPTQDTKNPSIQPTYNAPQATISNPDKTTSSAINRASDTIKNVALRNTDTSDYINRFNEYRQLKGCTPLTFTDDLNRIAVLRLAEIKVNYSHNSEGQYNRYLAENIVKGVYNNQDALACWEGSPGHNANMLDKDYKYTGYAAGGGYAVQVFTEWNTVNGIPQLPPGWYFPN
jgi:uncharacterized protein YkwD